MMEMDGGIAVINRPETEEIFVEADNHAEKTKLAGTESTALRATGGVATLTDTTDTKTSDEVVVTSKPVYDFVKRVADILIAIACLTIGLPIYLIIALAIVIDNPGNPLFIQKRVGKNGRIFNMVKFRTMRKNADQLKVNLMDQNEYQSVHFKMENDPRITRVGKFLRRTSLDETAQVINLLTGSMTVVGPRPFVISEQEQLPSDRLAVKPGLSCYWQLADTAKMSNEEQLELDYKYIRERSVKTDLKIIALTVKAIFTGKNC